jgi:hypothetical protein
MNDFESLISKISQSIKPLKTQSLKTTLTIGIFTPNQQVQMSAPVISAKSEKENT